MFCVALTNLFIWACQPTNGHPFFFSFMYGLNDKRESLKLIQLLGSLPCKGPWLVLGDFNCVGNLDERLAQPIFLHEVLRLK